MIVDLQVMNCPKFEGPSAACRAAQCYKEWKSDVSFLADLLEYVDNGIVIARHDIFGMAKIIDLRPRDKTGKPIGEKPQLAWFIRVALGDLRTLVAELPCFLPHIVLCRCKGGKITTRKYAFKRFMQLVTKEKLWVA